MDLALAALAVPRRRQILEILGDAELPVSAIAAQFDVTRPAISQHLGVLKAAGLVADRRVGTRRLYRARPEGLDEVRSWIDDLWRTSLARLKAEAEQEAKEQR
ncbi:MAG TPA: metalloregulator ArsR/SmtB family transcription factor [Candidatus Limnocylindrales bacterium]|nr:metalloregulator ArsR/SmtB family transcription factor [Candidatus Limnocylindrales bacterium]